MARQPHKVAHPACPNGATSWSACETLERAKLGQCRAMIEAKDEPHPCPNWAVSESGWCGQHHASKSEAARREERAAQARAELQLRIAEHIAMTERDPWFWVEKLTPSVDSTRGLPPYGSRPQPPKRKGPHRLAEPAVRG